MRDKSVHLTRRYSGGGTVFHDLGNTNFTFLTSLANHDKERNSKIIIDALSTFGLSAETSGRNDITIDGFKVSGAAYKLAPPRALHHGTLLINVDMSVLAGLLNPNKLKLQSKGIASVASRVKNLSTLCPAINHESLSKAIIASFCNYYGEPGAEAEELDPSYLSSVEQLEKVYQEMKNDSWRFGMSPDFTHNLEGRFESPSPWGTIDIHIQSSKGQIDAAQVYSDSLHPDLIELLMQNLSGLPYSPAGVDEALAKTGRAAAAMGDRLGLPDLSRDLQELGRWLKASL